MRQSKWTAKVRPRKKVLYLHSSAIQVLSLSKTLKKRLNRNSSTSSDLSACIPHSSNSDWSSNPLCKKKDSDRGKSWLCTLIWRTLEFDHAIYPKRTQLVLLMEHDGPLLRYSLKILQNLFHKEYVMGANEQTTTIVSRFDHFSLALKAPLTQNFKAKISPDLSTRGTLMMLNFAKSIRIPKQVDNAVHSPSELFEQSMLFALLDGFSTSKKKKRQ